MSLLGSHDASLYNTVDIDRQSVKSYVVAKMVDNQTIIEINRRKIEFGRVWQ